MPSRTWVTAAPDMTLFITAAIASELRPSSRAWSWSMRMRIFAARLDPIEVDAPGAIIGGDDLRQPKGDVAHLVHIRPADAVLHRPAHRRTELQRNDAAHGAGKSSCSTRSSLARRRSRAATSFATTTNWLKKSLGSSTLSGR